MNSLGEEPAGSSAANAFSSKLSAAFGYETVVTMPRVIFFEASLLTNVLLILIFLYKVL